MPVSAGEFPVQCSRFGIALSWDADGTNCDVDLQGVAFSKEGKVMDAVYYNNMKAFRGGLTHSGDELTGEKQGFDETIWINFKKLPDDLKVLVFVVACYTGGHLQDVKNGKYHLLEERHDKEVMSIALERSDEEVDVLGLLFRSDSSWMFRQIEEPAGDGQHFIDILEPTIGNCVRSIIPAAPRRIKACFAMEKGTLVDLPKSSEIKKVSIGLGWDVDGQGVDLDVSAVMLNAASREHNTVFFGNTEAPGIVHSGDNLTGEGDGDDEVITVNLEAVEPAVVQIVFVINIYTKDKRFGLVKNAYCRVVTETGEELCRYQLNEAGNDNGLIVSRILRATDGLRWSFQAVGQPCGGNVYKDSMRFVVELGQKKPKELQLRQLSTGSLHVDVPGPPGATPGATATGGAMAMPPPPQKSSACILL